MKKIKYQAIPLVLFCVMALNACKKEDEFLAAKPDQQLYVLNTLADAANMMHDEHTFNILDPALGEIASDDFYLTDNLYNGLATTVEKQGYIWAKTTYDGGADVRDWSQPYTQVYYANTVLDALPTIAVTSAQQALANEVKGDALFFRGKAFYSLVETFCLPYNPTSAATDLGIPLRLSSDLNKKSIRASEKDCYAQILNDLQQAVNLLPVKSAFKTQPNKVAAYGYLARVYLSLGDFQNAFQSSDQALKIYSTITDYNTIVPANRSLSTDYLSEDIFHTVISTYQFTSVNSYSLADSSLYKSFDDNDLRKSLCFVIKTGGIYFRGTYDFQHQPYSGLAVDELYLDRAECEARQGDVSAALKDLNLLLINRWKTGTFTPVTAISSVDALSRILLERRKEFIDRGLRWTDLRRLNREPAFATILTRIINGVTYTLPPGDIRYAWPIPDYEIQNSGIQQNQR